LHLRQVTLSAQQYPTREHYPFNLPILQQTKSVKFHSPVTFFVGENGTGKTTLLEAISKKCGVHIWRNTDRRRCEVNPYEEALDRFISVDWANGPVPGSFFSSESHRDFSMFLDEWAAADPGQLKYFGGKSLVSQSHGQSIMSLFKSRYQIRGIYFSDEPETSLSPRRQIELVQLLSTMSQKGHAQFIVATHSPILLACPGATIYSFDRPSIEPAEYEETEYYRIYKGFMEDRQRYLEASGDSESLR
jgi:predicted ATPase